MAKEERIYPVGKGANGEEYGVTRLYPEGKKTARKKPCKTCPWRKDAQTGAFPAEAFRSSASTAYDGSLTTFSCHETGRDKPSACAGFLLANADNNMAVRIAAMKGELNLEEIGNPESVKLYEDYRAMAIANGVNPDDPRIAPCRGNDEGWQEVLERMTTHGISAPMEAEAMLRMATDEDHDILMAKDRH